jgi:hypothetical protein
MILEQDHGGHAVSIDWLLIIHYHTQSHSSFNIWPFHECHANEQHQWYGIHSVGGEDMDRGYGALVMGSSINNNEL